MAEIAGVLDLPVSLYCDNGRKRPQVEMRQFAAMFLKNNMGLTHTEIGNLFEQNHTTILMSIRTAECRLKLDGAYGEKYQIILNQLLKDGLQDTLPDAADEEN